MFDAHLIVALIAVAANAFSGFAAITRLPAIMKSLRPALRTAGIPESWLTFPIGTLKALGAAGIAIGLLGVPMIGISAAIGLILFFVCATYTHVRVSDFSPQFYLASCVFLPLAVASLALDLAVR
jgi:hypothetical protein